MAVTRRKRKRTVTRIHEPVQRSRAPLKMRARPAVPQTEAPAQLYDFAPAMYVLLDGSGLITDINITGCRMLVARRRQLVGLPLRLWIASEHRRDFLDHLRRCRASDDVTETELRLR